MKKVILFDLDGTLVNSLEDLCDATNYMLEKLGFEKRTINEVQSFIGNGIDMLTRRAVGKKEYDFDLGMKYFKEYYSENMCNKTMPYENINFVIDKLKDNGFKLGVVTNKTQKPAEKVVKNYFGDKFDVVIGTDLEKRKKKPDAEPIELALKTLGLEKKDCIYIGDSEVDIQTAKNSQVDFLGVTWGYRKEDVFKDKVDFVNKPEEIITFCCNFL